MMIPPPSPKSPASTPAARPMHEEDHEHGERLLGWRTGGTWQKGKAAGKERRSAGRPRFVSSVTAGRRRGGVPLLHERTMTSWAVPRWARVWCISSIRTEAASAASVCGPGWRRARDATGHVWATSTASKRPIFAGAGGSLDLNRLVRVAGGVLAAYGLVRRGKAGSLIRTLGLGLAAAGRTRSGRHRAQPGSVAGRSTSRRPCMWKHRSSRCTPSGATARTSRCSSPTSGRSGSWTVAAGAGWSKGRPGSL